MRQSASIGPGAPGATMLLAHEWIAPVGGSENVFRDLMTAFPQADAVCLWNDVPQTFEKPPKETVLASTRLRDHKALALPFMPSAWRRVDLGPYDRVLASSHAFSHHLASKAVREGREAFSYVHTPARYVWAPGVEARGRGVAARAGSIPLRFVDRRAADGRVSYAANSAFVRDRIRRAWHVEAQVIHPPADVERIRAERRWLDVLPPGEAHLFEQLAGRDFVLGASRLVTYKRLDKVIEVGEALGLPVVIAGSGPDEARLRALAVAAKTPVLFAGRVTDEKLYALYQEASLFAFLSVEDFGIMPIEAIAAGTPALVNSFGGAREGVLALAAGGVVDLDLRGPQLAMAAQAAMETDMTTATQHIEDFSRRNFVATVQEWVTR